MLQVNKHYICWNDTNKMEFFSHSQAHNLFLQEEDPQNLPFSKPAKPKNS